VKQLVLIFLSLFVFGTANATLTKIGTAAYQGADYNLIWDDNNNGNSVVWLDYSHSGRWATQTSWAIGLDSSLSYNIDAGYNITWSNAAWRLPSVGVNPQNGLNQTTSEMGHLFYDELKLDANVVITDTELNKKSFDKLKASLYWYDKDWVHDPFTQYFNMSYGYQGSTNGDFNFYGLAIRSGEVSVNPVPEPSTIFLFGIGLIAIVRFSRER